MLLLSLGLEQESTDSLVVILTASPRTQWTIRHEWVYSCKDYEININIALIYINYSSYHLHHMC